MALGFRGLFPPRGEITANFDWVDIASATGFIVFDGFNAKNSTGNDYSLVDASSAITGLSTVLTTTDVNITFLSGNSGQSADLDFDLSPFQLPRTIEGDGFVKIATAAEGDIVSNIVITAKLRKWDGTTETEIASKTSDTFNMAASTDYTRTLQLTIPKTHFKAGEQIRLTIQISTGDNDDYHLAHHARDGEIGFFNSGNSRLTLTLPFKLGFLI